LTIHFENALPAALRTEWPYVPRYATVNGWRMHYIDEGEGDAVVLLHGNPTWGFLYRDVIAPLVNSGRRAIVPDMIGFGLSEKPTREQAHSLDGHTANLTALMRQLDLRRITLVCHDWGGPTGLSFAMSNPARVRALTIMSTWAWPLPPAEFHARIFPWRMMHAPLVGPYLMGNHRALPGRGVYLSVVNREQFARNAQGAYEAVLPDPATAF
jgi:pimeloyl-ACP methyl ester carboxylesterase